MFTRPIAGRRVAAPPHAASATLASVPVSARAPPFTAPRASSSVSAASRAKRDGAVLGEVPFAAARVAVPPAVDPAPCQGRLATAPCQSRFARAAPEVAVSRPVAQKPA